jgi:benzylsuccinate CoA-transferase BbsF subunit
MDSIINERSAGPQGNRDRNMAPHNVYRCSGDDEWVSIAVGNEEEWQALCQVLGDPPWTTDPLYTTMRSRWEHQDEMDRLITDWTRQRTKEEVTDILQHAGVAALPSRRTSELLDDPISKKRGTYIQVDHPMAGVETMAGVPWRMSETPSQVRRHGPLLGEHNEEISAACSASASTS